MRIIKLFEDFSTDSVKSLDDLRNKLSKFDIPFQSWGTGKSKNIEDLYEEIIDRECSVVQDGNTLVRMVEFVGIKVFYQDKEKNIFFLKEDRQEFNDGRIRRRNMPSSVSEKMKFGESPLVAGVRGLKEELGIDISISQLTKGKDITFNGGSISYPGLRAKYKGHQFIIYLDDEQFNPNGYVEIQKTKKTFFTWQKR